MSYQQFMRLPTPTPHPLARQTLPLAPVVSTKSQGESEYQKGDVKRLPAKSQEVPKLDMELAQETQKGDWKLDLKMKLVQVPEDNDCLFHCVRQTCFEPSETVESLRRLCAFLVLTSAELAEIKEDVMPQISEIITPKTWGGYRELALFSKYKEVEFVVFSSQTRDLYQRIRMPHNAPYTKRVYLYYCGVSAQIGGKETGVRQVKVPDKGKGTSKGREKEIEEHQKRTVHYNYFANAKSGTGIFEETIYPDKQVLQEIWKCIGPSLIPSAASAPSAPSTGSSPLTSIVSLSPLPQSAFVSPSSQPLTCTVIGGSQISSHPPMEHRGEGQIPVFPGSASLQDQDPPVFETETPTSGEWVPPGKRILYRCAECGQCTVYAWPPKWTEEPPDLAKLSLKECHS